MLPAFFKYNTHPRMAWREYSVLLELVVIVRFARLQIESEVLANQESVEIQCLHNAVTPIALAS